MTPLPVSLSTTRPVTGNGVAAGVPAANRGGGAGDVVEVAAGKDVEAVLAVGEPVVLVGQRYPGAVTRWPAAPLAGAKGDQLLLVRDRTERRYQNSAVGEARVAEVGGELAGARGICVQLRRRRAGFARSSSGDQRLPLAGARDDERVLYGVPAFAAASTVRSGCGRSRRRDQTGCRRARWPATTAPLLSRSAARERDRRRDVRC